MAHEASSTASKGIWQKMNWIIIISAYGKGGGGVYKFKTLLVMLVSVETVSGGLK